MGFLKRIEWSNEHNACADEWWPSTADNLPHAIMLGWSWCGTNVFGLFVHGRCWFGIEWRFNSEPAFGIIIANREFGFWFPEPE